MYRLSDGRLTFSSMTADAHTILNFFLESVRSSGQSGPIFVMGRSLGTQSAVGLVLRHSEHLRGLEEAISARVRSVTLPALIIHGERDSLIPQSEARPPDWQAG